jgi:hypothetical protein
VAAGFEAVAEAVVGTGYAAIVVPVADERVAVVPRETPYGGADLEPLALALSQRLRCPVLASWVFDSDVVWCDVYRDGERVHGYVSRQEMTAEWFEDRDGTFKLRFDGKVYPADHPVPEGPRGHDPAAFTCFAVGVADVDRIAAALRGDIRTEGSLLAEDQHWAIMAALGLPPRPLTIAYRHADATEFPGAVDVAAPPNPP